MSLGTRWSLCGAPWLQPDAAPSRSGAGARTAGEKRPSARSGSLLPPIKGAAAADSGADNPATPFSASTTERVVSRFGGSATIVPASDYVGLRFYVSRRWASEREGRCPDGRAMFLRFAAMEVGAARLLPCPDRTPFRRFATTRLGGEASVGRLSDSGREQIVRLAARGASQLPSAVVCYWNTIGVCATSVVFGQMPSFDRHGDPTFNPTTIFRVTGGTGRFNRLITPPQTRSPVTSVPGARVSKTPLGDCQIRERGRRFAELPPPVDPGSYEGRAAAVGERDQRHLVGDCHPVGFVEQL
jgi:hypothetical protein